MDDTNLEKNTQTNNSPAAPEPAPSKAVKKPKPFIEGITGPAEETPASPLTNKLTDAEKQLIKETTENSATATRPAAKVTNKIVIPSHKANPFKSLLSIVAVIIILTLIGYGGYSWYTSQQLSKSSEALLPVVPKTQSPAAATSPVSSATEVTETPPPVATTTPTAAAPRLKITSTPTGYLNVRQQPTTVSPIVTKVNPGETYPYTEFSNGWYKISLPDQTSGWVIAQYVSKQ